MKRDTDREEDLSSSIHHNMYQPVIGLEIHAELKTKSKMFCSCMNDPNEKQPNTNICPICLGHPGTLPVINQAAVRDVIKTGIALDCKISPRSNFDRKNYFYPDLPKGYQISQFYFPFGKEGFLELDGQKVRIKEIHLEEDTGRLMHFSNNTEGKLSDEDLQKGPSEKSYSLIDFNRAGVPLMELVTEPDLKSAKEAKKLAEEFQLLLRYLGVSDADMEKGQLRVEANISVMPKGEDRLGTKVEIKNLNSFRVVEKAIDFEIARQAEILESGQNVVRETRGWDDAKNETFSQREKEEAHDYRYFPEPDLPDFLVPPNLIRDINSEMPELPQQKRKRFKEEYKINERDIEVFVQDRELGGYFEKVVSEIEADQAREDVQKMVKLATNYLITDLQGLLSGKSLLDTDFLITPENFAELIVLIGTGKISSNIAKIILEEMFQTGADPSHIIEDKGLALVSDVDAIQKIIKEVISKNPKAVEDYKKGKANAFQFLFGQIMAGTKGKADPQVLKNLLEKELIRL